MSSSDVVLPNGEVMKEVSDEGYKYLGVLQNEVNVNDEMKGMVSGEYFRRLDSLLGT